jgi:hypothetical protein
MLGDLDGSIAVALKWVMCGRSRVSKGCPKWCNISLYSKYSEIFVKEGQCVYDEKEGFYSFCILFVFPSRFPLLPCLTFSCVCFTSPCLLFSMGPCVMCGFFASLSLFLIRTLALEPFYAKCPIGIPNGGDSARKSQKNAEVILK